MSIVGVAKLFLYKGQRVFQALQAELNLAPQPWFTVPWSASAVEWRYSIMGASLSNSTSSHAYR